MLNVIGIMKKTLSCVEDSIDYEGRINRLLNFSNRKNTKMNNIELNVSIIGLSSSNHVK
jgi:hypothetical protein